MTKHQGSYNINKKTQNNLNIIGDPFLRFKILESLNRINHIRVCCYEVFFKYSGSKSGIVLVIHRFTLVEFHDCRSCVESGTGRVERVAIPVLMASIFLICIIVGTAFLGSKDDDFCPVNRLLISLGLPSVGHDHP